MSVRLTLEARQMDKVKDVNKPEIDLRGIGMTDIYRCKRRVSAGWVRLPGAPLVGPTSK